MQNRASTKKYMFTAMCISLCIVLPQALHAIPNAGSMLLPMHIPVLLCGLICGTPYGLMCGAIGPLLSGVLTGMPPAAILPSMMVECASYGFFSGLLINRVNTGNDQSDLYISLLTAMFIGRIIAGISKAVIFAPGEMTFGVWVGVHFLTSFPGIFLQLILLPAMIRALRQAKLIPGQEAGRCIKAM